MADVRFAQVSKRYGEGAWVIENLNLEIFDHEFLVLVGPSGCGKTTALRMIAGLEEISAGDLYIGSRRVNDIAPKDRDIAMVFQTYALYPHMNVFDNMAFSLRLKGTPKAEITARVQAAATMLGLGEYLFRKPRALSGGQRQRVALGRALVREPAVFLLDEPLSNLDAKLRVQTRTEISRLHQSTGTTFIYVTHDQVEAMTMGDRIAVLNAGAIQQLGRPEELYGTPANLFVAGFIGSPSIDFFGGRLQAGGDGGIQVVVGSGGDGRSGGGAEPGGCTLSLSGELAARLKGQMSGDGRAVVVGIRPEDFRLVGTDSAEDGAEPSTLAGVVEVVEYLGNEQLIYVRLPGSVVPEAVKAAQEATTAAGEAAASPAAEAGGGGSSSGAGTGAATTARLPASPRIEVGTQVHLAVDATKLHLFDPVTTQRLA
jgi:multiple sugar transport system ATP-binding protein